MDIETLDLALICIAEKKNKLSGMDFNEKGYERIEEELHILEDELVEKFGDYLEEVLTEIHDEYCADNDVLLPIFYLARNYWRKGIKADGSTEYDVDPSEGVIVKADDYPQKICRLVLVPNPARILLLIGNNNREEVWRLSKNSL